MGITAGAGALTQGRARARQSPTQVENAHKQQEAIRKQQEALQRAAELRQMLNTLEKVDDEGRRSSLLDALCSTDDVLNLPLHPDPPGTKTGDLTVDLLKHQVSPARTQGPKLICKFFFDSVKLYNGVLSANIPCYRRKNRTSQFNSGSIERLEIGYVWSPLTDLWDSIRPHSHIITTVSTCQIYSFIAPILH